MNKQAFSAHARALAAEHGVEALAAALSTPTATYRVTVGCKPRDRFHVASLTKPVTAWTALDVVGPNLAIGAWPGVTCGDLLSHFSGYQCEYGDLARFGDGADALQRASRSLQSLEPMVPPRTVWSYSNAGYWLAAAFAAAVGDAPYEELVRERVLAPLELSNTSFDVVKGETYPRARRPSGGLVSTIDELLVLAQALGGAPGERQRQRVADRLDGGYGLGMSCETVGAHEVWGHDGAWNGWRSTLVTIPTESIALVVIARGAATSKPLRALADSVFESTIGARRLAPSPILLGAHERGVFTGTYANERATATVRLTEAGIAVVLDEGTASETTLVAQPTAPNAFVVCGGVEDGTRFDFPLLASGSYALRLHSVMLRQAE
ncbi:MAG: serine hydrolase [Actinobacteria bacterium]|uniref:Unannotated protein n=1 Tax=freshwater metagenome TaxID=449393 RepID=A0A6J6QH52_9ZZZZ|nr:serine hydrolase [Actinomycetota bacterium]